MDAQLSRAWNETCQILLGGELGDITQYENYLMRFVEEVEFRKSELSGKRVTTSSPSLLKNAKFISMDEQQKYDEIFRNTKLNLNEIKDIDSITSAIKDKFYYAGNIISGNSANFEDCDSCANSRYLFHSNELYDCKFMAYSSVLRFCENCFGTSSGGETKFAINCYEVYQQNRCMETFRCYTSNDCFYSATLEQCTNCLFSFNQKNKVNVIGNLQLEKGKFFDLKKKLLAEIREELKAKKEILSILDIMKSADGSKK